MVTLNDRLEQLSVERPFLDELQQPRFVFGTASLKGDCGEMLGCEDPRSDAVNVRFNGIEQRLLDE
jgi:hypothetical protein